MRIRDIVIAFFVFYCSVGQAELKPFIITMPIGVEEGFIPVTRNFIREVYKSLGFEVSFVFVPHSRGKSLFEKGMVDAELARQPEAIPAEGIKVTQAICKVEVYAYTRKGKFAVAPTIPELIKNNIVVRRGSSIKKVLLDAPTITEANTLEQMVLFYNAKRVDVLVSIAKLDDKLLDAERYVLKRNEMFHYIAQKHKDLVPSLEKEFSKRLTPQLIATISKELVHGVSSSD